MTVVGRYHLQERVGEGATADVFRAHDPEIGRDLAIKILKAEHRQNPEYTLRFLQEARAAGALSHPNIVTVYDVGECDGHAYIATEFLEGDPLDLVLRCGERLTLEATLLIAIQLAEALDYAHGFGVVHRDIKPSNIFVTADRRSIKILDFGIARVGEVEQNTVQSASPKTQIGQVLGTPRYMSPEQSLGQPLNGRSDLFSVGSLLYELVSGRRAFDGPNALAIGLQITQSDPPPLAQIVPHVPPGLIAIINRLLAKQPDRRFADGAQLSASLKREHERYLAAVAEAAARAPGVSLHVRTTLVVATVVGLVLAIGVGAVLQRQYGAMKQMTLSSGAAITSFVASNVALTAAENATLPPDQRDWAPVQAFTRVAAADPNIQSIVVSDAQGITRAASNPLVIGHGFRASSPGAILARLGNVDVSRAPAEHAAGGFEFIKPILYDGRTVGAVAVTIGASDLNAAASQSAILLIGLGVIVLLAVSLVTLITNRALSRSLRMLNKTIGEAADGDANARIVHRRSDELGQVFDSLNRLFADRLTSAADERRTAPSPAERLPSNHAVLASVGQGGAADATDLDRTIITDSPMAGMQPQAEAMSRLWDVLKKRRVA